MNPLCYNGIRNSHMNEPRTLHMSNMTYTVICISNSNEGVVLTHETNYNGICNSLHECATNSTYERHDVFVWDELFWATSTRHVTTSHKVTLLIVDWFMCDITHSRRQVMSHTNPSCHNGIDPCNDESNMTVPCSYEWVMSLKRNSGIWISHPYVEFVAHSCTELRMRCYLYASYLSNACQMKHNVHLGLVRIKALSHYNTLQHTATHSSTLQHAATRCNTRHTPEVSFAKESSFYRALEQKIV